MSRTLNELCCRDAFLRSNDGAYKHRASESISRQRQAAPVGPRVLVVEFRDEVYAGLKAVLEEHNCCVARAEIGAVVAGSLNRFMPDLVLVNETMPDESGWLITCKFRLSRHGQPVWLYTVRQPRSIAACKEYSGVNQVIEYGGVLSRLVQLVRQRLAERMSDSAGDVARRIDVCAGLGRITAKRGRIPIRGSWLSSRLGAYARNSLCEIAFPLQAQGE